MQIVSGDLKIEYDPFLLLLGKSFRIRISSENLTVQVLEEWLHFQDELPVEFTHLYADFKLGSDGLEEIVALEADSMI